MKMSRKGGDRDNLRKLGCKNVRIERESGQFEEAEE